jgi:hypothetical protein
MVRGGSRLKTGGANLKLYGYACDAPSFSPYRASAACQSLRNSLFLPKHSAAISDRKFVH